jgi:hypothetical protein
MKPGTVLVIAALLWPATAAAQSPTGPQSSLAAQTPSAGPPHPSYDKLQMFVGHWTIEGHENTYLEKCDWFDGRFHVVCATPRASAPIGPWGGASASSVLADASYVSSTGIRAAIADRV